MTNRYQGSDQSGRGVGTRTVQKDNATKIKHRLYSVFSAKVKFKEDVTFGAEGAKKIAEGVCSIASGNGNEGSARTMVSSGNVDWIILTLTADSRCGDPLEVPPQ